MITGTTVNYYFHCKRQCWLFYNKINLEDNSEDVRIGRVLHELKNENPPETIDNIKLDKITPEYVVEIKKSDADLAAATAQLEFYLFTLNKKGINRKGKLECVEKNKQDKKIHVLNFNESDMQMLTVLYQQIEDFVHTQNPPEAVLENKCKKCAYYEYCFI